MSRPTLRPITPLLFTFLVALSVGTAACSSDASADRTFDEQVEAGGVLYGEHCADCHGDAGQGTEDAPALVGAGALPEEPPEERQFRSGSFNTAADIFAFADEYMPATDPDAISDPDLVDVLAFALSANGIELDEQLTLDNADDVVIHE